MRRLLRFFHHTLCSHVFGVITADYDGARFDHGGFALYDGPNLRENAEAALRRDAEIDDDEATLVSSLSVLCNIAFVNGTSLLRSSVAPGGGGDSVEDVFVKGLSSWSRNTQSYPHPFCIIGAGLSRGRPKTRWSDLLEQFAGASWEEVAADPDHWAILEAGFVDLER